MVSDYDFFCAVLFVMCAEVSCWDLPDGFVESRRRKIEKKSVYKKLDKKIPGSVAEIENFK